MEEVIKLFKQAKERSAERPKRVVVDGLWAYEKGFKKVFTADIGSIKLNLREWLE